MFPNSQPETSGCPSALEEPGIVARRYGELAVFREPFLKRARECAAVTIPSLLPPQDSIAHNKLPTPYQSVGAAGVNNLAAKLLLTLFPPNGSFFRLLITSFDLDNMVAEAADSMAAESGGDPEEVAAQLRTTIENEAQANLGRIERAVVQEYEAAGNRATDYEAFKHLVAVGNVLRFHPIKKGDKPRVFALNKYVVRRDPDGLVLEIITKEGVSPASLSKEIREACKIPDEGDKTLRQSYELYTRIRRTEGDGGQKRWEESQELNGIEVPKSRGYYPINRCPWLALRWSKIDGEDYGRGHVEDYLGDLISLNGLKKALVDGSMAAARTLFLVSPAATTRAQDIAKAPNGSVIPGMATDVTVLKVEKANDFNVALSAAETLTRSLGQVFLMTTSIQRAGERVTAEEIRRMAGELESALGGNYSILALEYLLPLVELTMHSMQKQKRLPDLPDEVQPTILTGVQALGRNADLERDIQFLTIIGQLPLPQEELFFTLNPSGILTRIAANLNVETRGIIRTEQEEAELRAQRQQEMAAQAAAPQMVQAAADMEAAGDVPPEAGAL